MKKTFITSLTLMLLFLICICLPVYAAENTASEATVTFDADPQTASRGATVTVTVVLSESDLAKSMMIEPVYDTSVLELQSGEWLLTGATLADNWTAEFGDAAIAYSAETDMNGEIFKLTFKVLDNASFAKTSIDCNVTIKNGQLVIANTTTPIEISVSCTTHSGGTKTCTSQAICDICHTAYGDLLSHNYDNGNWKSDASGHWKKCLDCVAEDIEHKTVHHYDNSCDTTCNAGCGYIRTVSHDYEELKNSTTEHWYECDICGEEQPNSRVAHSGGTATCQAKAECSICGQAYGKIGDHSYNMSAWGYKGADGHARKCAHCDAHDELQDHTPNVDAATEQMAKYCTACDFVIEQQLNHVHSEGTTWEYNSTHHWHDCIANDGQEYSKDEHSYDNACDTDCNACGAPRTITHDYSKLEKNETHHWYACSICGVEKANSRAVHIGGSATCQVKATCSTCNVAYGNLGDHDYDTTKWVSVDESSHAHKCKLCTAYTDEAEHFSEDEESCTEDKLCDACGHKMKNAYGHSYTEKIETSAYLKAEGTDCQSHHTYYYACVHCNVSSKNDTNTFYEGTAVGDHKMSVTWTSENNQHFHKCTVNGCTHTDTKVNCSGGTATCQAKAVCETCGVAYGMFGGHCFDTSTWGYKDASGHAHKCTLSGCDEHDTVVAHTPNIDAATEQQAQVCDDCEYEMAAQLSHTHNPASEWTYNDTHHWHACSGCNSHLDEAPHSYANDCDTTCDCGYVRTVTHDFTGAWQKDADGHWHVCADGCGTTDTKANHVSASAATETDPEVCSICGWEISPALGHTTHTPETEWQKNDTHHWHECTGCKGQELDKAAHANSDNNGKCDACDYTMSSGTVDPGTDPVEPGTDEPVNPGTDDSGEDDGGLNTGAIIGIVVASVAVSGGGGFALCWFVVRKKRII